jgi:hypothetical protein
MVDDRLIIMLDLGRVISAGEKLELKKLDAAAQRHPDINAQGAANRDVDQCGGSSYSRRAFALR